MPMIRSCFVLTVYSDLLSEVFYIYFMLNHRVSSDYNLKIREQRSTSIEIFRVRIFFSFKFENTYTYITFAQFNNRIH